MTTLPVILKLRQWIEQFEFRFGMVPTLLPVTREERVELNASEHTMRFPVAGKQQVTFWGINPTESHYADLARYKIISLPVEQFMVSCAVDELAMTSEAHRLSVTNQLMETVAAHVLADSTSLSVPIECDAWAWLKRWLTGNSLIPLWFRARVPDVKVVTFLIDGRVLYPHLKVQLPHLRHVVKFQLHTL